MGDELTAGAQGDGDRIQLALERLLARWRMEQQVALPDGGPHAGSVGSAEAAWPRPVTQPPQQRKRVVRQGKGESEAGNPRSQPLSQRQERFGGSCSIRKVSLSEQLTHGLGAREFGEAESSFAEEADPVQSKGARCGRQRGVAPEGSSVDLEVVASPSDADGLVAENGHPGRAEPGEGALPPSTRGQARHSHAVHDEPCAMEKGATRKEGVGHRRAQYCASLWVGRWKRGGSFVGSGSPGERGPALQADSKRWRLDG